MGHLDQERQNLQSTKHKPSLPTLTHDDGNMAPIIEKKSNDCVLALTTFEETKKGFMDLCRRFPHPSSRGSEYILVVYNYDSNAVDVLLGSL